VLLVATRVTTSSPDFDATYCTLKDPVFEPDEGEMPLPSNDVRDQELTFATRTGNVAADPCCTEAGPATDPYGGETMLSTVTASSPAPQALDARPE
jgi:hypothetical protein